MLLNLKEILEKAVSYNFAVGGFNVTESTMFKAVVEEAESLHSPVIIQVSPNEFNFSERELYLYFLNRLQRSRNPFVLHYDHSKSYEGCIRAIQAGFTSVMFDGSHLSYKENVMLTKKVVEAAHGAGVSVEGEIGTIGETDDYDKGTVKDMIYTSPDLALRFVEETGVDALAVSIGTVHGMLPNGYVPKLQLPLLKELAEAVTVPLVLHGGSGTPHDEVATACKTGIHKVNISSEIKYAYYQSVKDFVIENPTKVSPTLVAKDAVEKVKDVVKIKIQVLNSLGTSKYYN
ncbi:class II fructose-bisphosphate aldolase [Lacrimispora sp.]|uniref:class II fructose-bisphosphate aldolase n=1 Tax=Lacrimispora sp. TaxID=2719234 RepID=UPI0028AAD839|nr:ketose-bisphosphate aldolase [Lacrimispora sp.]